MDAYGGMDEIFRALADPSRRRLLDSLNTICPGPTDTEGAGQALWPEPADRARVEGSVPLGRLAGVEEIAWWSTALCSRFGSYVTGMNFTIDGGHWLEQESYMPSLKPRE